MNEERRRVPSNARRLEQTDACVSFRLFCLAFYRIQLPWGDSYRDYVWLHRLESKLTLMCCLCHTEHVPEVIFYYTSCVLLVQHKRICSGKEVRLFQWFDFFLLFRSVITANTNPIASKRFSIILCNSSTCTKRVDDHRSRVTRSVFAKQAIKLIQLAL